MASSDCLPLQYVDVCKDAFYFSKVQTDICTDAFQIARPKVCVYIQSREHKFLMIHDASCAFQVEDLDSVERQNPDCRFHIQPYKDSSHNQGNPVMLYVQKNDEKIMVCCRNDSEVCAKKMEPPKNIQDEGHEALFYQTDVCGDMYKFKSTKYKGSFLGFDYDENDLYKLVLLKPAVDEVDERCHIIQPLV